MHARAYVGIGVQGLILRAAAFIPEVMRALKMPSDTLKFHPISPPEFHSRSMTMPSPADDVIALYQDHAAAFEAQRGTTLVELGWLTQFLSLLPVPHPQVLDIGCGSGVPIARHLIENGCSITGIDTSLPLLTRAQSAFPNHRWIAADMRRLPFTEPFHGLIAWHSFFHLSPEDQRPMFSTFRRLASPGAVLMFTSGTSLGEAIGQFEGKPLYHGSLDREEYRQLLNANGFAVKQYVENDPACGGATVWLAQREVGTL